MQRRSEEPTTIRCSLAWRPALGMFLQGFEPNLMKFMHAIRHEKATQAGNPPVLGLFREDVATLAGFFHGPGVIGVHSNPMRGPGDPFLRNKYLHSGFD